MTPLVVQAIGFGVLIGLLLGLVGGGGSILTVPILVYVLGLGPHAATATSLVIVGLSALSGAIPHARAGRVQWRTAALFGLAGVLGAFAGAWANRRVSGPVILFLFGLLMLIVAARMAFGRKAKVKGAITPKPWAIPASGLIIGIMTGFFGVGGGFLIVPALVLVLGLPMRVAVGTSLVIIALNSASGVIAQWSGGEFNWPVAVLMLIGGFVGGQIGALAAGRVDEDALAKGFGGLVAAVGVYLIYRNGMLLMPAG